jgi:hypothetical protein
VKRLYFFTKVLPGGPGDSRQDGPDFSVPSVTTVEHVEPLAVSVILSVATNESVRLKPPQIS